MSSKLNYRTILLNEFETRKRRNASYNLSSFARLLDIPPSRLSEILRSKVGLSVAKAEGIAKTLKFSENETRLFMDMVCAEHGRSSREKDDAKKRIELYHNDFTPYHQEHFDSIADWYHHAIVELIGLNSQVTPAGMSAALGVELSIIEKAVARLIDLQVISFENNEYNQSVNNRETTRDVPSEAIKKLNEQILDKAASELRLQSVEDRDFSIAFLSFNKSQMALAKERIREFRRNFMKEFESAPGKNAVYCTAIQFFELTGNEVVDEV